MNVYFNEVSVQSAQPGIALALAENLIVVSKRLKTEFGVEQIKVPKGFKQLQIAGDRSFSQLIQHNSGVKMNTVLEMLGFLANGTSELHGEIDDAVNVEFENKTAWSAVKLGGISSYTLTGAHLLKRPAISFNTTDHAVDFLSADLHLRYANKEKITPVRLENIYDDASIETHHAYLINCKNNEAFKPNRWRPNETPLWNQHTSTVLKELNFPESLEGMSDVKGELQNVGRLIAEMNSWRHDEKLSGINSNSGQIRDIFVSVNGRGTWYLSTDVKNYNGTFELCDWKGRHEGQISFTTGKFIPRENNPKGQYTDGSHNIDLERRRK